MDIKKINELIKEFSGNTKEGELGYVYNPASLFKVGK